MIMKITTVIYDRICLSISKQYPNLLLIPDKEKQYSSFFINPILGPMIIIGQKNRLLARLCGLSHELGHFVSFLSGTFPKHYSKYLKREKLSARQLDQILEEEKRAWRFGFDLLRENEMTITAEMKRLRDSRLAHHRREIKARI